MIFKVKNFNDLGKCSFGTLLEKFNTNKDHIYIAARTFNDMSTFSEAFVEVKINNIDDLSKFLWCIPFVSTNNNYFFTSTNEWWKLEFNECIERNKTDIEKYTKSLEKTKDVKRKDKLTKMIQDATETKEYFERRIIEYNTRKSELIKKLKDENN